MITSPPSASIGTRTKMAMIAANNCATVIIGREPPNLVTQRSRKYSHQSTRFSEKISHKSPRVDE
jgi:hypothetical protein